MSENPLQSLFKSMEKVSTCVQTHLSNFIGFSSSPSPSSQRRLVCLLIIQSSFKRQHCSSSTRRHPKEGTICCTFTKEELGRVTWTFLHTLAAQVYSIFPDNPTRQQKKDVKDLMAILSRTYPCQECADHFKDVLRTNPVQAGSHSEFSRWMCQVHNVVNRSLGKSVFPCERVDARWGKLECDQRGCAVQGALTKFD